MGFDSFFNTIDVSSSGLKAEQQRMNVIAQNIANAHVTRGEGGEPYRRQEVVFETVLNRGTGPIGGVRVRGVVDDRSPFIEVRDPGHPDADSEGIVRMPNVKLRSCLSKWWT
jgi:flagellar basal-body rod protein FlgC